MNYSSKKLSLVAAENLLNLCENPEKRPFNCDGILLLTAFGFVYGKFQKISDSGKEETISDCLINAKEHMIGQIESENDTVINDGPTIALKDAVIKYPANNYTINMAEIIIFTDQVIGYYPIDLSTFGNQYPQQ